MIQGLDGSVRLRDIDARLTTPIIYQGDGAPRSTPWYDEASDAVWVASSDRLVRLPLGSDAWRERACDRVGRDLSQDEWDRLVPGGGPRIATCSVPSA